MWVLFDTNTNTVLSPVDRVPAKAMNRFVRDFPWLIVVWDASIRYVAA